ncbi:hypothetical protein KIN20_003323 [Parelaphostrongylus tenuis]|uniref:Uncharacterized protein n=1 Tax=Parelaphostrongylus tenuis TaxID=148309 RepID=A0AAD5MFG2_PARTN|nr:hypothetical protein KIN20_003323 [Parelaphostrongylus tenuis]
MGQLFLFIILPRKPGQQSLIKRICGCCGPSDKDIDLEAPTKEIMSEMDGIEQEPEEHFTRAFRWSKKMMAKVNTVAEELEHVIGMASIHHQEHSNFMYSETISDEDTASEKTIEGTFDMDMGKNPQTVFKKVDLILNPETLARRLASTRRLPSNAQVAPIRRTVSSPVLKN